MIMKNFKNIYLGNNTIVTTKDKKHLKGKIVLALW